MKTRFLVSIVAGVALFLLGIGLAGVYPFAQAKVFAVTALPTITDAALQNVPGDNRTMVAVQPPVASTITYQGRLTDSSGQPIQGTHTMRFLLYTAEVGGTAVWDSGDLNVTIIDGLFKVGLNVSQADFDGQELWLSIIINGQTLSPRQSLQPVPYALSLRPGANIVGSPASASTAVLGAEMTGNFPNGQVLAALAPATGTAVHAQGSGGQGVYGYSDNNYAVHGASDQSWGGYFTSNEGYALRASTGSSDHWNHAGYFQANGGYGLYATSDNNMAIRGEAGDITGLWQPVGSVGVVGVGQARGVYGSGGSSYGIYATSLNWYGIYGRTSRSDHNYGLYSPDNLYTRNINMAGAIMNVAQNGGDTSLEPGDVVVFSGISEPLATTGSPIIQVARATEANSSAVAGVVYSRFNIDVTADIDQNPHPDMEVTPGGPVPPGEYLLIVVQGPAQVKANTVSGALQPGDLLSTAAAAGTAVKAEMVTLNGIEMAVPGTILGKALESLSEGQSLIYVFVTLQ